MPTLFYLSFNPSIEGKTFSVPDPYWNILYEISVTTTDAVPRPPTAMPLDEMWRISVKTLTNVNIAIDLSGCAFSETSPVVAHNTAHNNFVVQPNNERVATGICCRENDRIVLEITVEDQPDLEPRVIWMSEDASIDF